MSNIPNLRFTLISNLDRIKSLGQVGAPWLDAGNAGAPWTNNAGNIRNVNPGTVSNTLYQPATFIGGKRYLLLINFVALTDCVIRCGHAGDDQYFYSLNVQAAQAAKTLTCDFFAYANTQQQIQFIVDAPGGLNISFSAFLLQEVDSLTRVIMPGGFKSLAKRLTRLIGRWGFIEDLDGAIDIIGADLQWLRGYLIVQPDKRFDCLIEIDDQGSGVFEKFFRGMIDTTNIAGRGVGNNRAGQLYSALLPFLKEEAWSRFTSYLDVPINMYANKGVHNLDCIDAINGTVAEAPAGLYPRLRFLFDGTAKIGQKFTLAPDDNMYLGFADVIAKNDGYDTYSGISKIDSIRLPVGKMRNIQGAVKITWSGANIVCEAIINNTGQWVALAPNVESAINITETYLTSPGVSGYAVRFRNTLNNASATVTLVTTDSYLRITNAQVEYNMRPLIQMPLLQLKAYAARTLGDYDNLVTPAFEDMDYACQGADSIISLPFQNPPPKFKPYNGLAAEPVPLGNFYDGGFINWTRVGTDAVCQVLANAPSNVLLIRCITRYGETTNFFTTYWTKGQYLFSINLLVSVNVTLQLVGIIDHVTTVIQTFNAPLNNTNFIFTVDNYYEALGIRMINANSSIQVDSLSISVSATPNNPQGRYYLTGLSTGHDIKIIATPQTQSLRAFDETLNGLQKIFGLGLEPRLNSRGQVQMYFDELRFFFTGNYTEGGVVYAEDFEVTIDPLIIRDYITVGGPARSENEIDKISSCALANYTSTYITSRARHDLTFTICLNSGLILNEELGNDELCLFDLSSKVKGSVINYRTANGLSISSNPASTQPNWLHSEGRIIRRNLEIISGMGSQVFSLIGGMASTTVVVDYPPDFQGPLADSDLIFATPKFTPWLQTFETAISYAKYKELFANRFNKIPVSVDGQIRPVYIKDLVYNPFAGKAQMAGWLVNDGDFSLDFSDDFNNTSLPVEI